MSDVPSVIEVLDSQMDSEYLDIESLPLSDEAFTEPPQLSVSTLASTPLAQLPTSSSSLFAKGLYTQTLLETTPLKVCYKCTYPKCGYSPKPTLIGFNVTGNLWKHIYRKHGHLVVARDTPHSSILTQSSLVLSALSSSAPRPATAATVATFFEPNLGSQRHSDRFCQILLKFIISNNLPLSLVDRPSFATFVRFLSPATKQISRGTLARDLWQTFINHCQVLKQELLEHIVKGGRLSLTTDALSARNFTEHAAVMIHWINDD